MCSGNVSALRMHTSPPFPRKGNGRTFGITLIESDVLTLHRNISPDATECTISRSINLLGSQSSFSKVRKELSAAWLAMIYNTHIFWVDFRILPFLFFSRKVSFFFLVVSSDLEANSPADNLLCRIHISCTAHDLDCNHFNIVGTLIFCHVGNYLVPLQWKEGKNTLL